MKTALAFVITAALALAQLPKPGGGSGGGGGTAAPPYAVPFTSVTTITITAATHGLGTSPIPSEVCWDNGAPQLAIAQTAGYPQRAANGDVTWAWTGTKTGNCYLFNASASGSAGGDLTGAYPNPTIAADAVTLAKIAAAAKYGTGGTKLPTMTDSPTSECAQFDANGLIEGAGAPCGSGGGSHATSHQHGGADEVATATPGANVIPKAGGAGTLAAGFLPNPGASSLGGVRSLTCSGTDKLNAIGTDGIPVCGTDQNTGGGGGNDLRLQNTVAGSTYTTDDGDCAESVVATHATPTITIHAAGSATDGCKLEIRSINGNATIAGGWSGTLYQGQALKLRNNGTVWYPDYPQFTTSPSGVMVPGRDANGVTYFEPDDTIPRDINGTHNLKATGNLRFEGTNNGTGTIVSRLAKWAASNTLTVMATSDTAPPAGIVIGGAGNSGTATVVYRGNVSPEADNTISPGDYLIPGTATAGRVRSAGATEPTSGWILGVARGSGTEGNTFSAWYEPRKAGGGGGSGDVTGGSASATGELSNYADTTGKLIGRSFAIFSGPASSAKTYTLPNSNATIVYDTMTGISSLGFGATPAASGRARITNNESICWRNAANSADICITLNGSDIFQVGAPIEILGSAGPVTLTEQSAPGTPASGKGYFWADSTDSIFKYKSDAGTVSVTVVPDTGASNNFLTAISAAGVVSKAQPSASNLSNGVSGSGAVLLAGTPTITTPVIGAYTVSGLPAAGTANRVAIVTDAATAGSCTSGGGSEKAFCRDTGSAWASIGDGGSGGGGSGTPNFETTFSSQTSITVTGATHGIGHAKILVQCYDNSSPKARFNPSGWTVDGSSFDVVISFASATSGSCVLNGSGTAAAFSALTSGTNTTMAALVGSGASLGPTGTGTITATNIVTGAGAAPTSDGAISYDTTADRLVYGDSGSTRTVVGQATTDTLTNKTVDAEGTGNVITMPMWIPLPLVACAGTTGSLMWDTLASLGPTATCSAGSTNTNMMRGVADFPDSDGDYSVQMAMPLPPDLTGTADLRFWWRAAATSGDVVWQAQTACVADAEVDDVAWNTASTVTDTAKGTANQVNTATITGLTITGCAATEILHLRILRNRTHASDSITGVVSLGHAALTIRRAM